MSMSISITDTTEFFGELHRAALMSRVDKFHALVDSVPLDDNTVQEIAFVMLTHQDSPIFRAVTPLLCRALARRAINAGDEDVAYKFISLL